MNCNEIQDLGALEAHATGCPVCASLWGEVRRNEELLRKARVPGVPDTVWPRVQAGITERRSLRFIGMAAASLFLVFSAVALFSGSTKSGGQEVEVVDVSSESGTAFGDMIPSYEESELEGGEMARLGGARR